MAALGNVCAQLVKGHSCRVRDELRCHERHATLPGQHPPDMRAVHAGDAGKRVIVSWSEWSVWIRQILSVVRSASAVEWRHRNVRRTVRVGEGECQAPGG